MEGDNMGRFRMCQTVAVTLLLCSLVLCFSLWGLGKKVKKHEGISEAAVKDRRNGSILFNRKKLNFQSISPSAAATGHGLLQVDLHQSGNTAKYTSKLKNDAANEAEWRQLNASLHCGDKKMKLKAMGPGAADIQLHIDNVHPLPLKQVPERCGFSIQQNALGLVLIVPYNGCSVLTESGRYVLPVIWRGTAVRFICPITNPDATPAFTTPEPVQQPQKVPFSLSPWHFHRSKRQAKRPVSVYSNPYNFYLYNYYMHMMALATAKTKPTTTTKHPLTKTPAYSYPLYYPYNTYYPYNSYYLLPNPPAMTTVPPATTTFRPSSNKNPPQNPVNYASYLPYMHYLPPAQQLQIIPEKTQVYYYPNTEFFYGRPPYQHEPNLPTQPTWSQFTTVAVPGDPAPPIELSYQSPVSSTSSSAPTAQKPIGYNHYLDVGGPYVPFEELPFKPYVVYKSSKFLDDQKYMAKAGFKSGFQGQPGFPWQIAPRFPQLTGQEHP